MNLLFVLGLLLLVAKAALSLKLDKADFLSDNHAVDWPESGALVHFFNDVDSFSKFNARLYFVTADNKVFAYGRQTARQNLLGQGAGFAGVSISQPLEIVELRNKNIVKFVSSNWHMLALSADGRVWAWGENYYGQLGTGNMKPVYRPVLIEGLKDVIDISNTISTSFALTAGGQLYAWGYNGFGECGLGTMGLPVKSPKLVNLANVKGIWSSFIGTTYALTNSSAVYAWGVNAEPSPALVRMPSNPRGMATSYNRLFVITEDGNVIQTQEYNQLRVEPFYSGPVKFKTLFGDQHSTPSYLIGQAIDGQLYSLSGKTASDVELELLPLKSIPHAFMAFKRDSFVPFMFQLNTNRASRTTAKPKTTTTSTTTKKPKTKPALTTAKPKTIRTSTTTKKLVTRKATSTTKKATFTPILKLTQKPKTIGTSTTTRKPKTTRTLTTTKKRVTRKTSTTTTRKPRTGQIDDIIYWDTITEIPVHRPPPTRKHTTASTTTKKLVTKKTSKSTKKPVTTRPTKKPIPKPYPIRTTKTPKKPVTSRTTKKITRKPNTIRTSTTTRKPKTTRTSTTTKNRVTRKTSTTTTRKPRTEQIDDIIYWDTITEIPLHRPPPTRKHTTASTTTKKLVTKKTSKSTKKPVTRRTTKKPIPKPYPIRTTKTPKKPVTTKTSTTTTKPTTTTAAPKKTPTKPGNPKANPTKDSQQWPWLSLPFPTYWPWISYQPYPAPPGKYSGYVAVGKIKVFEHWQ